MVNIERLMDKPCADVTDAELEAFFTALRAGAPDYGANDDGAAVVEKNITAWVHAGQQAAADDDAPRFLDGIHIKTPRNATFKRVVGVVLMAIRMKLKMVDMTLDAIPLKDELADGEERIFTTGDGDFCIVTKDGDGIRTTDFNLDIEFDKILHSVEADIETIISGATTPHTADILELFPEQAKQAEQQKIRAAKEILANIAKTTETCERWLRTPSVGLVDIGRYGLGRRGRAIVKEIKDIKEEMIEAYLPVFKHDKQPLTLNGKDFDYVVRKFDPDVWGKPATFKTHIILLQWAYYKGITKEKLVLPIPYYMELLGLTNDVSTRRNLNEARDILTNLKVKNKSTAASPYPYIKIGHNTIEYRILPEFLNEILLTGSKKTPFFMDYPLSGLRADTRYFPHTVFFATTIANHMSMNHDKSNALIIGVDTIINGAPNFPTWEDAGKDPQGLIIIPFEHSMDGLKPDILWEYQTPHTGRWNRAEFYNANIVLKPQAHPVPAIQKELIEQERKRIPFTETQTFIPLYGNTKPRRSPKRSKKAAKT